MTDKAAIEINNLNVYYGKYHALKGIDVEFPKNKISVIIGPSGCGKSTLLRSLNRLVENVEGTRITGKINVEGTNILDTKVDVTSIRRNMGLLAQRPCPLPMSIFENVAYGMRIHGKKDRQEIEERVTKYLREVNLWNEVKDRLHAPAISLSIGQQQRLCLARGLAVEPHIILGDEPTSAIDPVSTTHIEAKFKQLSSAYTIILVTHILRQAKRLADYVLFLYMGELIEHGPADRIFSSPKEELTRKYIEGIFN